MSCRFLALVVPAAVMATAPVAGQVLPAATTNVTTPATKISEPRTLPGTPWGDPDLQGVWLNNSATPLERPKGLEGKPFLTDEEVAELKKRAARLFDVNGNADF